ncbi:(Fe-S)-binding protein [Archaeoglobales archaeon]|nr:MAG: (Fe-S)-binding protein [Archaeoglobales archaeon]
MIESEILNSCIQCGTCVSSCCSKSTLNLRRILASFIGKRTPVWEFEQIWYCTTCHICQDRCPRGIGLTDAIVKAREEVIESGNVPPDIRDMLINIQKHRNPFGISKFKRDAWAKGLDIPTVKSNPDFEYLWYVGCANSFDTRNKQIAAKTAQLFNEIGLNYAILGREEGCCGNDVKMVGEEGLFELLKQENFDVFEKYNVKKIVVLSPHCYHIFKNEYGLDVKLAIELIYEAIITGNLKFSKEIEKKVTFHDPCYLGRYNNIYDLPRELIKTIPMVELVEMQRIRERSFCCGGGGGNVVRDYPNSKRPNVIRVQEAKRTDADILAVACPFCMSMLEDAVKTLGLELEVKDVVELIWEAVFKQD